MASDPEACQLTRSIYKMGLENKQTRTNNINLRQPSPRRIDKESSQILWDLCPEERRVTVGELVDLVDNSFSDFLVAVAETWNRGSTSRVEKFLTILKKDIASFPTDGFFGNEMRVPM